MLFIKSRIEFASFNCTLQHRIVHFHDVIIVIEVTVQSAPLLKQKPKPHSKEELGWRWVVK